MPNPGKGAVAKTKKTEKELKKERQEEVQDIIAQIRTLLRLEQATAADSPEWKEFETALSGFLNGNVKGNAAALSMRLLDNIQNFAKGKKSFIESAKGQQVAEKLHKEMSKVPGALEDPQAAPLIEFLGHWAKGEIRDLKAAEKERPKSRKTAKEELEKKGWVISEREPKSAPKTITVEEGKKEQEEAMEAVRKLHKDLGAKSPEEIKKEQQQSKGLV